MKVFTCPDEIKAPEVNYANFNHAKMLADEATHQEKLKVHMVGMGYNGPRTGEIISFGVADGSAQYMFADAGAKSALIHLPYGDAYHYRDVGFLPRKEILKRLDQQKSLTAMFAAKAATKSKAAS